MPPDFHSYLKLNRNETVNNILIVNWISDKNVIPVFAFGVVSFVPEASQWDKTGI